MVQHFVARRLAVRHVRSMYPAALQRDVILWRTYLSAFWREIQSVRLRFETILFLAGLALTIQGS